MKFIQSKLCLLSLSFLSFFLLATVVTSAEEDNAEYKIKAGYIYNFIKFITWPPFQADNFNICLLGHDPFGTVINSIESRTAFGRPIKLLRLNTLPKAPSCQIIYVDTDDSPAILDTTLKMLGDDSKTLVVGEGKTFIDQGGMIALVKREGGVKLAINLNKLRQSGLVVSAKLLEVAEVVGENSRD